MLPGSTKESYDRQRGAHAVDPDRSGGVDFAGLDDQRLCRRAVEEVEFQRDTFLAEGGVERTPGPPRGGRAARVSRFEPRGEEAGLIARRPRGRALNWIASC